MSRTLPARLRSPDSSASTFCCFLPGSGWQYTIKLSILRVLVRRECTPLRVMSLVSFAIDLEKASSKVLDCCCNVGMELAVTNINNRHPGWQASDAPLLVQNAWKSGHSPSITILGSL